MSYSVFEKSAEECQDWVPPAKRTLEIWFVKAKKLTVTPRGTHRLR